MENALFDRKGTPLVGGLHRLAGGVGQSAGQSYEALGGVITAIEYEVLDPPWQLRLDISLELQHLRDHDGHIHARVYRMIQKHRVHCPAHAVVATE